MSINIPDYPFGKKPVEPGDVILLRGKAYKVVGLEPTVYNHAVLAVNGVTERVNEMTPRQGIVHYFQYMTISNPQLDLSIERPQGSPHVTVDLERQYLNGAMLGPNTPAAMKFSVVSSEPVALVYQTPAGVNLNVVIRFFGYRMWVISESNSSGAKVLDDFVEYQK